MKIRDFDSKKRCNVERTKRFDEWKVIAMEEQISKNVIWRKPQIADDRSLMEKCYKCICVPNKYEKK